MCAEVYSVWSHFIEIDSNNPNNIRSVCKHCKEEISDMKLYCFDTMASGQLDNT